MLRGLGRISPVEASDDNAKKQAHQVANEKIQVGFRKLNYARAVKEDSCDLLDKYEEQPQEASDAVNTQMEIADLGTTRTWGMP